MGKIYSMSDIHGHLDLMERNLEQIDLKNKDNILVFCGDYIGYGPESCRVLYRIKDLMEKHPKKVIALKGNHETMFLEFLSAGENDVWSIEWLGGDKDLSTTNTFISEETKNRIKIEHDNYKNPIDLYFEIANVVKDDIKTNHRELIKWLDKLPLYYETDTQIFVHAGIDEEAEDWWQHGTSEEMFVSKYPATFGKFYKDIIAGHVGTNSLKNEEGFYGVYWDSESHYYIDGTVIVSGNIPLLIYDNNRAEYIYD